MDELHMESVYLQDQYLKILFDVVFMIRLPRVVSTKRGSGEEMGQRWVLDMAKGGLVERRES